MEIATPARSSPFPKLTFDHQLIIAKHLVSTNDEKRKTPNHLIGDESSTCDLMDGNYENGAKSRLNETKINVGVVESVGIDKGTVGVKPIIVEQQRQDDMPSKMSENHLNGAAYMIMKMNGEDLCNNINVNNTPNNRDNASSNIKQLPYDANKSLDGNIASVTVHDGSELSNEIVHNNNTNNYNNNVNCNSKIDNSYNENCKNDGNNNHGYVSSSGTTNNGISVCKEITFKVPELTVSPSYSSTSPSPTVPYRKQSVFVAPAGLNRIIHKSRNYLQSQQQQSQQHLHPAPSKLIDSSGVPISTPTVPTTSLVSPSSYSSIPSTSFYSSTAQSLTSSSTTLTSSSLYTSEDETLPTKSCSSNISNSNINNSALSSNATNSTKVANSVNDSLSSSVSISGSSSASSGSSSGSSIGVSNFTLTRKNSTGLQPKANAQEIEQHISKIISENAAIVETLDPLWSKRYLSRHSVSSVPSGSTSFPVTLSTGTTTSTTCHGSTNNVINLPSRRYSEIVVDPNHVSGSKLQSALLGRIFTTCSITSGTTVVTPSNVPLAHQHIPVHHPGPAKKFSEPIYPSVIINMKQQQQQQQQLQQQSPIINITSNGSSGTGVIGIQSSHAHETGLEPSLVRNLLTSSKSSPAVRVIPVPVSTASSLSSSQLSTVGGVGMPIVGLNLDSVINRGSNSSSSSLSSSSTSNATNNPENPEGSIIKDLLLKARDSGEPNERKTSRASLIPPIQEELSMLVYVCTLCKIAFRNKETLEAHQLHYCKANETQSTAELSFNQLQLLNDHVQRKMSVMESNFLQQQLTKPVQSTCPNLKLGTNIFTQPQHVNLKHPYQSSLNQNQQLNQQTQAQQNQQQQQPIVGNILKQQLLAPSAGPPLKKRKTSEPLFSKSHLRYNHHHQQQQQLNYNHHYSLTNDSNSHFIRKTSLIQGLQSKLPYIGNNKSNNKEGLTESDYLNSGLSSSSSSSSSSLSSLPSSTINSDNNSSNPSNHVISVLNEPITFSSTNNVTQSAVFSSSNPYNKFINQSSLDRANQPTKHLDILPDYYPHLKYPETKVTLTGPIVFPVLRKILLENKENIEFQASPEALHTSDSSCSLSSPLAVTALTNPSGHSVNDSINPSYLVYKQIPSIPEFDEDQMEEKVINDKISIKIEEPEVDQEMSISPIYEVEMKSPAKDEDEKMESDKPMNEMASDNNKYETSKINGTTNRPTSLTIRKFSTANIFNKLISSTLVSPDTPRPKRKCMQLYMKGQTYTYLGLKMSTRSTYCCIYRPQPMYVPQEAQSKLSMYSNWQIISPHDEIFKLISPSELFHAYDTRQWCFQANGVKVTFAPSSESKKLLNDSFILTPSSYWTIKKQSEEKALIKRELLELKRKGMEDLTELMDKSVINSRKTSEDRASNTSGFDSDSGFDPNQPKRVKIFEGGFKSNEDYTYVRGRGRGKYVCEECGIRCKKPSMLKKHIRTHTDLRPYSCRHCAFAFKTKGNLTKHMKSKAHHKKCVELGIIPVPITIDDSQIDCDALAKQEALERSYSGGHLASDDDENDDEDGCEEEDDEGSDDEGVPIPITRSPEPNDDLQNMEIDRRSEERNENDNQKSLFVANEIDEQEVARSLLVLSGEWPVGGNHGVASAAVGVSGMNPDIASTSTGIDFDSGIAFAPICLNENYIDDHSSSNSPSRQSFLQRRYSMSVIQDNRYNEEFYLNSDGPIDLSKRQEDNDNPIAGPSSKCDQILPGRRNTLSTPSAVSLNLSRSELGYYVDGTPLGITREDGKSVCRECNKAFSQLSQLRLHVNVHFLERPFKCYSCGVSFRTKGHLQKHEKSVTHADKVKINLTFGAPTVENPRPFKCEDCVIAFRIHGHLAKHLRSKNHIMKLECLGKLPCGMYADMERFGISLNFIETSDCENSLLSLQRLAERMYSQNGEVDAAWCKQSTAPGADCSPLLSSLSPSNSNVTLVTSTTPLNNADCTNLVNTSSSSPVQSSVSSSSTTCLIPSLSPSTSSGSSSSPSGSSGVSSSPSGLSSSYPGSSGSFSSPLEASGSYSCPLEAPGSFPSPLEASGTFLSPLEASGSYLCPSGVSGSYSSPLEAPGSYSSPPGTSSSSPEASSSQSGSSGSAPSVPTSTTQSYTTTPINISTTTTSSTTNITSIRSNTCHFCKQVFKSAKFLQVHLYCDHQQDGNSKG